MESNNRGRTRVLNVKQSKLGCYTCKQRRIKCDEVKPACLRCQRSKRVCGGFSSIALSSDSSNSSSTSSRTSSDRLGTPLSEPSPAESFNLTPWSSTEQRRLSELTCTVLGSDPHGIHSPSNAAVFVYLLPQLVLSVPCVSSAAAAFGAAYESAVLQSGSIDAANASAKQYGNALQLMQIELRESSNGHIPLLIASVLLAAAETIQHRQRDALQHIIGAFTVFNLREQEQKIEDGNCLTDRKPTSLVKGASIDVLEDVFRSMDIQIATFVWGKRPFLKSRVLSESMLTGSKIEDLINDQPTLCHACLHFVATASEECYRHYDDLPFALIHQQGQLISWLRLWITNYDQLMKADAGTSKPRCTAAEERHLNLLKSQVLAILITIANIKTSTQTSYDQYEREFGEIIRCAEVALGQTSASRTPKASSALPAFSPSPGVIQPLFFLARKCRHSVYRRRAISLLRISGIEGPFNGDLEAAVAERVIEIEEDRPFKLSLHNDEVLLTNDIPDSRRIASCWRLSENDENRRMKSIKLCRRKYPTATTNAVWRNTDIEWEMWEEYFSFDLNEAGGFQTEPKYAREKRWHPMAQESFWGAAELDSMSSETAPRGGMLDAAGAQMYPLISAGDLSVYTGIGYTAAEQQTLPILKIGGG